MIPDPKIFRAYDIRGTYPTQLNENIAYRIAQAYVAVFKPKRMLISMDVRESGPVLKKAVSEGLRDAGVDVIDIGMVCTDIYYFAVATNDVDGGIHISASHNPREYNGMNISRRGAVPVSSDTGLIDIKKEVEQGVKIKSEKRGELREKNVIGDYLIYLKRFINFGRIKPYKIVANPNFGMQGLILKKLIEKEKLPLKVTYINEKPDGSFPKGRPDPLIKENRAELVELVKKMKADLGVAWDADGDRCFFVDDKARFIEGYFTTAVLAKEILRKYPGAKIIIDPRLTWASIETIKESGGVPIINKAGMTFITERMRKEDAVFAGEMSAHYYFKENFYRDNGMIPLFMILEMMAREGKPLSYFYDPYFENYFISGELNFETERAKEIMNEAEKRYSDGKIEHIDGLSVEFENWRFNLRPSNTEPLLRLNVEAKNKSLLEEKTEELKNLILSNRQ